ncbi:MAG: hypothetical protein GY938_13115 [Ketobacter sp.]|nr:hypothetical protein [Ketobacter sp.]
MLKLAIGEPWGTQGERIAVVDIDGHGIVTTNGNSHSFAVMFAVDEVYWISI